MAQKDVEQVHTSARKITSRFDKIEKVELLDDAAVKLLQEDEDKE